MAENQGVWGIDIGLAGLKAIRLVYAEAAERVIATAFDYVPHPKILSQPDANPDELISQALDTFLSRNSLHGDSVAISVPGQTALARFIQLPPVEASKVVEIVKYEARQQIPFALDEVIWDYQPLGSGTEESGFLLDAEVGLFAMKRDQVQQHLQPYLNRKVEVDLVQIAPLALYNYLCHDRFGRAAGGSDDMEQEDYTLMLDMGADNTTLLVSNGKKIWIRNVPLGGNHFTRALTKEMKLTFAKAEHLKCNATKAPDPKAVFQALRPVFNDYVAEIQRSIGYFSSVNRDAKIGKILGVGNGFKLAGLQKFLQQNLQMDVERVDGFHAVSGDAVLNAPLFQENVLSFAVPYGLALQGLKITRVHTSLLPPEITAARLIRKKKPWAVATAALLLVGLATSAIGYASVWHSVSKDRFGEVETKAETIAANKDTQKANFEAAVAANTTLKTEFDQLVAGTAGKTEWLEVYKAINVCVPTDCGDALDETDPTKKQQMRIFSITATKYPDLGMWFTKATKAPGAKDFMLARDRDAPPTGPGYVFRIQGRHFHADESDRRMSEVQYVQNTLLANLKKWKVEIKDKQTCAPMGDVPVRQLGISHATIVWAPPVTKVLWHKDGMAALENLNQNLNPDGTARTPTEEELNAMNKMYRKTSRGMGRGRMRAGARPGMLPGAPGMGMPGMRMPGMGMPGIGSTGRPGVVKQEGDAGEGQRPIPQTGFTIEFVWKPIAPESRTEVEPEPAAADPLAAGAVPGAPGAVPPGAAGAVPGAAPAAGAPPAAPAGP